MNKRTRWIVLLWLVAIVSMYGMSIADPPGLDAIPCWTAIQSVSHGNSPYAKGMVAFNAYYSLSHKAGDQPPCIYWYSPLTIPILRVLAFFPGWLLGPLYACAVVAGFLLQLKAGYSMAREEERRWLIFLLPFAAFFPGLLNDGVILGSNVAYILYGLVLAAAIPGWKQNKWLWFYLAVLAASICKAPMLTLLAFPVLVGRKQWIWAGITGAVGCLLFAAQPFFWPALFKEFLLAVRAQFDLHHDFGFGPTGVLGKWLWEMNIPYSPATTIGYFVWVLALGTLLVAISLRVRRNPHLREIWIPIAFVGALLMNPRIKEYDIAPLTVPLFLIAWRSLRLGQDRMTQWRAGRAFGFHASVATQTPPHYRKLIFPIVVGGGLFVACNVIKFLWEDWIPIQLVVLLLVFSLGYWSLRSYTAVPESSLGD
jgi:hypothetical protein